MSLYSWVCTSFCRSILQKKWVHKNQSLYWRWPCCTFKQLRFFGKARLIQQLFNKLFNNRIPTFVCLLCKSKGMTQPQKSKTSMFQSKPWKYLMVYFRLTDFKGCFEGQGHCCQGQAGSRMWEEGLNLGARSWCVPDPTPFLVNLPVPFSSKDLH